VILRFDEFELDTARFVLKRAGDELKLEPKVLALIVLLAENRDRMLTKEELLSELWGKEYISESVLPRCVHHARAALGDSSQSPRFIKTVHGRGYRFADDVVVEVDAATTAPATATVASPSSLLAHDAPQQSRAVRWRSLAFVGLLALAALVFVPWDRRPGQKSVARGGANVAPSPPPASGFGTATAAPVAELVGRQLASRNDDATFQFFTNIGLQRRLIASCGDADSAVKVIEDALAKDPGYAPAWLGLGVARYAQVWACGLGGERTGEALAAFDRAVELAPERTEAAMARATILATLGQTDAAYELCQRYLAAHPENPNVLYNTQYVLRYAGFLDPARELLEKVVEVDPGYLARYPSGVSPATYLYLDEWDRFLALLPANDDAYSYFLRGLTERLRNRPEAARGWLEASVRAGQSSVFGRLAQALLAAMDGRDADAERLVEEVAEQRRSRGATDGEITYKEAEVLALAGRDSAAARELRAAVDEGFFCVRCLELDPSFAAMRDDPGYLRALDVARQRHLAFASRFGLRAEDAPPAS
jgi:DNA-binding winged helix-turn-helix (wHTH) protein/tetratricopeptide (TPR) repeat protein